METEGTGGSRQEAMKRTKRQQVEKKEKERQSQIACGHAEREEIEQETKTGSNRIEEEGRDAKERSRTRAKSIFGCRVMTGNDCFLACLAGFGSYLTVWIGLFCRIGNKGPNMKLQKRNNNGESRRHASEPADPFSLPCICT